MNRTVADKIPVAVLGATGSVGQKMVELLNHHPWFYISALSASDRSVGKSYKEAVNWLMPTPLPEEIGQMKVLPSKPSLKAKIAFSALDASVAGSIEEDFARAGYTVVSNAKNHRFHPDVPLLIPEVNPGHLEILKLQKYGKGKIITNPNCSTTGLVLALKPLMDNFGLEALHVVTMQALSGAGYPGVSSLDIMDNVIPFISGEEEKIEREPLKILGTFHNEKFVEAGFKISATCNRVPVIDGHLEAVSLKLKKPFSLEAIIDSLSGFRPDIAGLNLPSAPKQPIHYVYENNQPQPRKMRLWEKGMAVTVGRLRPCPLFDIKFHVLSHNTIRGAAGGAILNAELLLAKGMV